MRRLLRLGGAVLMIAAISLAGGGLVVGLDHPATGGAQPELTARGDAAFERAVPGLAASLAELTARTDALAAAGRETSTAVRALDPDTVQARLADGEGELVGAVVAMEGLRASEDAALAQVSGLRLSGASTAALGTVARTLEDISALPDHWAQVAARAGTAADLIGTLQRHDELVFDATEAAREERYEAALMALDGAEAVLEDVVAARDSGDGPSAPTLDEWLLRASDYGSALRRLYDILLANTGQPDADSQAAADDVAAAQAALPEDGSALVVISTELTEPGLTEGLVGIERARGSIAEAVMTLD